MRRVKSRPVKDRLQSLGRRITSPLVTLAVAVLALWGLAFYSHFFLAASTNGLQLGESWLAALDDVQRSIASEYGTTRQMTSLASDRLKADDPAKSSDDFTSLRLQTLVGVLRYQSLQSESDLTVVATQAPQFDDLWTTKQSTVRVVADVRVSHASVARMARSIVNLSRENRHHDAHQMADALGDLLIFIGKQSKLLGKQSQQQLDTWRKQIQARRQALFWGQTALAMMIGLGLSWVASGGIRQRLRAWISRSKASSAESDVVEDECREFAGRNILVVDDGAHNRRLTATIVAKWGARIGCAADGQQAVEMVMLSRFTGEPFDLILMDLDMPVMDGITATKKLRESDYDGSVVAITGTQSDSARTACLEAGCNDFITKPFKRDLLKKILAAQLNSLTETPDKSPAEEDAGKELAESESVI